MALLFIDRVLKSLARSGASAGEGRAILKFELFRNSGIAFSLPFSGPLIWLASACILAAIAAMAVKDFSVKNYARVEAYVLFFLGACSNLFDRISYGYTVDYLIFWGRSAVNVADGMIVAGACWLILRDARRAS